MARLGIYTGTAPDAGDGDNLLDGAVKINSNFTEVYTLLGDGTNLLAGIVTSIVAGDNINVSGATGQVTITAGAGGTWATAASGIHTSKNVGIGTDNPTSKLTVSGDSLVSGVSTATQFYGSGVNLSGIVTSIVAGTNVTISGATGQVTINASGGGGGTGYFEQNTTGIHTLSNVGIGTTTASSVLTVSGNTLITGILTATSFIKSGGTSSQFLKADGSVDSNTYLTTTGNGSTLSGIVTTLTAGTGISISQVGGSATITNSEIYWESLSAGINTTTNVGLGTTNPQTPLQIENVYGVKTGLGTFVASAGIAHTLDSFTISSTDFKTSEYTIHINYNSNIQAQKLLVMQNGSDAYSQEYAIMFDPNIIVSIGATVVSGELRLEVTPETGVTGLTTYRFTRQTML